MFMLPVAGPNPITPSATPLLESVPKPAEIVELPLEIPLANPPEAPETIVAAAAFDEFQVTRDVKLLVVLSELVPVAVNCNVPLTPTEAMAGVIAIETGTGYTVNGAELFTDPDVAVIVATPPPGRPVASPEALTLAAPIEDHTTLDVTSETLLSE
jgi:hypothetical protein